MMMSSIVRETVCKAADHSLHGRFAVCGRFLSESRVVRNQCQLLKPAIALILAYVAILRTVVVSTPGPLKGPELPFLRNRCGVCITAKKRATWTGPMQAISRSSFDFGYSATLTPL